MFNLKLIFRQCVRIFVNYNKKVYFEFRNARTTKVQVVIITMMLHSSTKTGELSKHVWPSWQHHKIIYVSLLLLLLLWSVQCRSLNQFVGCCTQQRIWTDWHLAKCELSTVGHSREINSAKYTAKASMFGRLHGTTSTNGGLGECEVVQSST